MTTARLRHALLLSIFLALLLVMAICWPRERLLLNHAASVVSMDDWDEYRPHKKAAFGHNWLSDHEVLFAKQGTGAQESEENQYFVYDTRSGMKTLAVQYQKALQMAEAYYGVRFSPNRQWFYAEHGNGDGLDVVKWDGSRRYSFKEKGYPLLWLSDSLYINAVLAEDYSDEWNTEKNCLRLRNVTDSHILKDLPEFDIGDSGRDRIRYCADHFVTLSSALDETTHQVSVEVTKTGLGLTGYPTRKQRFMLSLPGQENIKDVEGKLSPDGTRIVYRCVQRGLSPLLARLHRLFPRFNPKPQQQVALWVSEIDGNHLHEVGHLDLSDVEDYLNTYLDFEWLPSGKRLAFRYKERLYTAPAD